MLDDLSTGSIDNIAHLKAHPRFHYTIDSVDERAAARRAHRPLRRRVPSGRRRRREADCRSAGPHDRDQRARHRGRAEARQQEEEAGRDRLDLRGLRQEHRRARSAKTPISCSGPTPKHRWAYACSKAIDEFLALAYWKERKLPVIIVRLLQHRRPAADRPVRHGDPELRPAGAGRASRSPCSATARRRAASRTSATSSARSGRSSTSRGQSARCSTSATAKRSRSWRWPSGCATLPASRSEIVRDPYDQAYEAGFEDMPRRVPDSAKIDALIGYAPTRASSTRSSTRRDRRTFSQTVRHGAPAAPPRRARNGPSKHVASRQRQARAPRCSLATGRDRRAAAGDRPDRKHQPLQREVRVLPARRDGAQAGRHGHGALQEGRRRVRRRSASSTCACTTTASRSSIASSSRKCATRSRRASRRSA